MISYDLWFRGKKKKYKKIQNTSFQNIRSAFFGFPFTHLKTIENILILSKNSRGLEENRCAYNAPRCIAASETLKRISFKKPSERFKGFQDF